MSKIDIIRSWKDESYRLSLSEAQRALLPESPAGPMELDDAELSGAGAQATAAISAPWSFCACATKSICSLCGPIC